ncbi:MAG: GNAT family N-acetyltransferase [Paracoccaceae bacterium]
MTPVAEEATAITVEPATVASLMALAPLYVMLSEAHRKAITEAAAAAKLRLMFEAGARGALFSQHGRVIGSAMWMEMGDHVFIRHFVIEPALRGRGVGRKIAARLVAEQIGAHREIRLEAALPQTVAFWEGCGFDPRGTALGRVPKETSC